MKIIDQTPFYNHETGAITTVDRLKALLKFGPTWTREIEAQAQVIPIITKLLDRSFTLLRNVTPPGLDASFPFILVGPAGVFVMYVTPLTGMFRARGNQWGTISGSTFKDEKPNLLTRTERMARAIQVYLQRNGYQELTSVDGILLCSDPSVHVDSLRPIIRIVMRDALERFAISISQSRVVLNPEAVQNVIEMIINPPIPAPSPAEEAPGENVATPLTIALQPAAAPTGSTPDPAAPPWTNEVAKPPFTGAQPQGKGPVPKALNSKQITILIGIFVIWCLLMAVFLGLVLKDQLSTILSLLP